jgi:S-DNA-T family DNA segregation ATPase FtsK/SpoIIIE
VDLVPGEDVGTAMASGFCTRAGLLRTHHIRKDKTVDQLTPIVARALQLREDTQGRHTVSEPATAVGGELDLLADVAVVMAAAGKELMRTQEVIAGLAVRNRAVYTGYTFTQLKDGLPEAARPYKTKGFIQVNAHRVAEAPAERDLYPNQPDDPEHSDGAGDEVRGPVLFV